MRARLAGRWNDAARSGWNGPESWLALVAFGLVTMAATWDVGWPNGSTVRFWAVWLPSCAVAIAAAAVAVARRRPDRPTLRPVEALAIAAILAMLMTDATLAWQPLRDLAIYLRAGRDFLDGAPVYAHATLTAQPEDRSAYPFLYPPMTLPLFAALAVLPTWLAQAIWVAASLGLVVAALRLIGVPWPLAVAAPLWPPLFEGLWVGNVAVPTLVLLALGPWLGASLVLGAVFKPYTGLTALWLPLEGRWRALAGGLAAAAALAAVTVPLTGLGAWREWLDGLRLYQESQPLLPGLYGMGLPRYVPYAVYVLVAAAALGAAVVAALRIRGHASLAHFGVATVVASPSLFGHGFLPAVPALLPLSGVWLWLALGFVSVPHGPWWWLSIAVVAASWVLPGMRGGRQPWPGADGVDRTATQGRRGARADQVRGRAE